MSLILALESSCDESAVALLDTASGILGEWVHSQIDIHREYGGVVPEIATRAHLDNFAPLITLAFERLEELGLHPGHIDQLAVTRGPGLAGCLALGIAAARALAAALDKPLVGVNHLRGHVFSPFINLHADAPEAFNSVLKDLLPHLALVVSGGNTLLVRVDEDRSLHILGQTVDDAAGEALDKGAKLLGMPYPGGPLVEKTGASGDPKSYDFPRAFADTRELKFSFSGLKTSLRYRLEAMDDVTLEQAMPDLCASYQEAVVDQLVLKTKHALEAGGTYKSLGLSGGVANNKRLRQKIGQLAQDNQLPWLAAEPRHTGDNAAMIAFASYCDAANNTPDSTLEIAPSEPVAF